MLKSSGSTGGITGTLESCPTSSTSPVGATDVADWIDPGSSRTISGARVATGLIGCINQPSVTIGQAAITNNAASDNQYRTGTFFVARSAIASPTAISVPCHRK